MLALSDDDGAGAMADLRVIPKCIALDGGAGRAGLDPAAVADLKLGAVAAVAEQRARVVAATHRIIARREILEAQQRLPGILSPQSQREGELGGRPHFAIAGQPQDGCIRLALEAAWRDVAGAQTIDS